MAPTNVNLWRSVDWLTISIYLILVILGWFSVCGASYNYGDFDFFSFDSRAGKQLVWIGCSLCLGFVLLMLEDKLYDMFSYILYIGMMFLLLITPFLAEDTKGSYSWLKFGPISLQPAEFAKFATALALAKFMSSYSFNIEKTKHFAAVVAIILLPMFLIIMQRETGSALVYLAFFFMLYREGMPGSILFVGICAVVYFVVGIKFSTEMLADGATVLGDFAVLSLIIILSSILVKVYCNKTSVFLYILFGGSLITGLALLVSNYYPFDVAIVQYVICAILVFYLIFLSLRDRMKNYFYIALFAIGSVGFSYSASYLFENVLEDHQQIRIKVVLGMEEDLTGAGYNVNQSKIAIGSGGMFGKGFLNGTQTKLKYVPEQDTDFIFCTVGEEQGFIGSAAVMLLFTILILRLIVLSERQYSRFARVYGYSVLSIFLFHMFINIGMVIGLTPVIGIPLPFFSYGGSSLWGFTILLFVFLRMDAARKRN
ncbi:rod shape-determining protein RodA [Phocaeicola paurosaccharolyticus]|uniref:rod shape-determining protein RodA n=1 Tax=Phocaeicola paurosaccharolyticus TaxID=732242 RepID=UPI000468C1BA|nr:rod shape-determining protein RodA [Phocaeicola paurosaccharolyticus]